MFRGSVKGTGHQLHSPVSPSLAHPCVTVPSHFNWSLLWFILNQLNCRDWSGGGKWEINKCRLARWCYIENILQNTSLDPVMFKYLYCSPNIVRVIKSRRMRWAGHVARMGEERGVYTFLVGNRRGRDHWGDLGVDGWIILGWISRSWDVGEWTRLGWPRIETGSGHLWLRQWTFGFREIRGISWLAANQLASQEGLCTMG